IEDVLGAAATKREAAARLGMTGGALASRMIRETRLLKRWRALPADGAFAGRDTSLPRPCRSQADADALVAEAALDPPSDPSAPQRVNIVRLLLAMYAISGSVRFPRGWTRALILAMETAGARPPTVKVARWYRSRLSDAPGTFASVEGADPQLIEDIEVLQ